MKTYASYSHILQAMHKKTSIKGLKINWQ